MYILGGFRRSYRSKSVIEARTKNAKGMKGF